MSQREVEHGDVNRLLFYSGNSISMDRNRGGEEMTAREYLSQAYNLDRRIRMHEQRQERADLFEWKGPGRADQDVTKSSSGQNSRRELSFTEEVQT